MSISLALQADAGFGLLGLGVVAGISAVGWCMIFGVNVVLRNSVFASAAAWAGLVEGIEGGGLLAPQADPKIGLLAFGVVTGISVTLDAVGCCMIFGVTVVFRNSVFTFSLFMGGAAKVGFVAELEGGGF